MGNGTTQIIHWKQMNKWIMGIRTDVPDVRTCPIKKLLLALLTHFFHWAALPWLDETLLLCRQEDSTRIRSRFKLLQGYRA